MQQEMKTGARHLHYLLNVLARFQQTNYIPRQMRYITRQMHSETSTNGPKINNYISQWASPAHVKYSNPVELIAQVKVSLLTDTTNELAGLSNRSAHGMVDKSWRRPEFQGAHFVATMQLIIKITIKFSDETSECQKK